MTARWKRWAELVLQHTTPTVLRGNSHQVEDRNGLVLLDDALCGANKCEHQQTQYVMREDLTALPVSSQGTVIPLCPNFLSRSRDMIPNYGRHILPTNIGGKNAFHCVLRGSRVDAVDCGSCSTPCDYAGNDRNEWCVLYTPAFCRKCTVECSMAVLEEFNNEA